MKQSYVMDCQLLCMGFVHKSGYVIMHRPESEGITGLVLEMYFSISTSQPSQVIC